MKQLSISIVSYNTLDLLRRNLASIFKFTKNISFEVIVVDNHSSDGSAQMVKREFPQVKLIVNQTNRWYTGANNQALAVAQGKYFLILNSDIFLKNNAFKSLVSYLEKHQQVGAIEPLQCYEDGRAVATGSRHNRLIWDLAELTLAHKFFKPKSLRQFRLISRDRKKTWSADVICDAALLLRTKQLKKMGGYDEKFKLYYTENDLCRRCQQLGLKTVHYSGATVWHRVSASTDKAGWKEISTIFAADARIYYQKHHSWLTAWSLFLAMKLSNFLVLIKQNSVLILILALATWLRFDRLEELMVFIGDQGRDYLAARDMLLTGKWPLVGIASSVPWLKQGPFFIWLTAFCLKLSQFNPVGPAILTAVLGVVTVYLVYYFTKSRLAALVMASSPLAVVHSRMPYHISPIPLFSVLYLIALRAKAIHWSYFLSGILLQFELTTLPLLFLTWWRLKRWSFVWLIPFIPKFIYDFSHGFTQTLGLAAWAGHRLIELRPLSTVITVTQTIWLYWQKFVSWDQPLIAAVLLIFTTGILFKNKLLFWFMLFNLAAFYLHAGPSEAYFPVLFPVWAILLGSVKAKGLKAIVIGLALFNSYRLMVNDYFPRGSVLAYQNAQVKLILAKNEPFYLKNPDEVEFASFLDNYRYLIWWQGGREDPSAKTSYTFFK